MVGLSYAQSTNSGDIRGSVTDPSGALIPGVTVTVLNVDTGVSKEFATNRDGLYDTSSIVTGRYQITFTKDGFQQLVRGLIIAAIGLPVGAKGLRGPAAKRLSLPPGPRSVLSYRVRDENGSANNFRSSFRPTANWFFRRSRWTSCSVFKCA